MKPRNLKREYFPAKSTSSKANDLSSGIVSSSLNHFLAREVKYGDPVNKLDEYVDRRRKEIYARMRVPLILESHCSTSTDILNTSSQSEISHDMFNYSNTTGSKLKFCSDSKDCCESEQVKSRPSDYLVDSFGFYLKISIESNLKSKSKGIKQVRFESHPDIFEFQEPNDKNLIKQTPKVSSGILWSFCCSQL